MSATPKTRIRTRSASAPARLVERPELVARLREGRRYRLTLVSAPAGYGKTTLLAQWEHADRRRTPFAWISLDERASDPIRLWAQIIAALHEAHEPVGSDSLPLLTGGPPALLDKVVPAVVGELAGARRLVLVLDDWHLARSPLCDASLQAFVERAPPGVQVVVVSRSDPGLPIARLRAHGDLLEIRERDLRFSSEQAAQLFAAERIPLGSNDVERLTERTEGWLAGLCLARIVAKQHEDPAAFVADFSGDSTLVLDFLVQDVLARLHPALRDFVVRASALDRLSAPLCNAALGRTDSAAMLQEAQRENLFLVVLDDAETEYRFHRLFTAALQRELNALGETAIQDVHRRASLWFEAHNDVESAIGHAIASHDVGRASELVTRHGQAYWASGRIGTVASWLSLLSWPEAEADPQLALIRAQVAGQSGADREEIERWLAVAEKGDDFGPLANGISSRDAAVAILRGSYLSRGPSVAAAGLRAFADSLATDAHWRGNWCALLGQAEYLLGHDDTARPLLDEVRTLPTARVHAPATVLATTYASLLRLGSDKRAEAESLARLALDLTEERHLDGTVVEAHPRLALGAALAEASDVHGAILQLERSVALARPAAPHYWHVHASIRLASALCRADRRDEARERLAQAERELDLLPEPGILGSMLADAKAALTGRHRREGFLGDELSDSERRVLDLLVTGRSVSDVGRELWLSPNTVKTHRRSIYRKLGVSTREQLLQRAETLEPRPVEPSTPIDESGGRSS